MRVWVLMHRGRERSGLQICSPRNGSNLLAFEPLTPVPWCEYESEWVEADLTFPCQHTMACSKCGATS